MSEKDKVEDYNEDIIGILQNLELRRIYGIKRSSEFNAYEYFHIIGQQLFGFHHKCWPNLSIQSVTKFISHKTGFGANFKVKQNAIETRNFFKLHQILVGNMVLEDR